MNARAHATEFGGCQGGKCVYALYVVGATWGLTQGMIRDKVTTSFKERIYKVIEDIKLVFEEAGEDELIYILDDKVNKEPIATIQLKKYCQMFFRAKNRTRRYTDIKFLSDQARRVADCWRKGEAIAPTRKSFRYLKDLSERPRVV